MWECGVCYSRKYEKVLGEWENRLSLRINKYVCRKLFVDGGFEDGVSGEEDKRYFELEEVVSFGLSYSW